MVKKKCALSKSLYVFFNIFNGVFAMSIYGMLPHDAGCISSELITPESTSLGCPSNYRKIMPVEFIECAKLASEKNFNEVIKVLNRPGQNNQYYPAETICLDLKEVYFSANKNYSEHKSSLDPRFTIKDFIYEDLLRYFWWSHYYPIYEGLI